MQRMVAILNMDARDVLDAVRRGVRGIRPLETAAGRKLQRLGQRPAALAARRLWRAGCASFAAVAAIFVIHAVFGDWTWMQHLGRHFASQIAVEFLPVPVMFFLWLRAVENGKPWVLSFSPFFCAVSVACFVLAQEMGRDYDMQQVLFGWGVVASLFVMVPFWKVLRTVITSPRPAICAVLGASAACNYYYFMRTIWTNMRDWTSHAAANILHAAGVPVVAELHPKWQSVILTGPHIHVEVNPGCNGLEGIFLFNFMLSVMLLVDWQLFRRCSIVMLYAFGVAYMFLMNALRISVFYSVGLWTWQPGVPPWVASLRVAPMLLFHSYIGWTFYLIAFGLFAFIMYRTAYYETMSEKMKRWGLALWRRFGDAAARLKPLQKARVRLRRRR